MNTEERIRHTAFRLWQQAGASPTDDSLTYWCAAEKEERWFQSLAMRAEINLGGLRQVWRCPRLVVTASTRLQAIVGVGIICLSQRGRVEFHIAAEALDPSFGDLMNATISGITDLDAVVVSQNCYKNPTHWDAENRVCYYSFLAFEVSIGCPTQTAQYQVRYLKNSGVRVRKSITIDCDITLEPAQDVIQAPGAIQAVLTAQNPLAGSDIDQTLEDVTSLLGVAFRAHTQASRIDYYGDGGWLGTKLIRSVVDDEVTHDLIPWTRIGSFLSQAVLGYRANERNYSLQTVLSYYIRSHVERTLEIKFILASVLVEALKFYWARNVASFTPRMNANGTIKEFVKPPNGRYSFKDLVDGMTAHLGLTATYTFIEDRNALFHTGLTVATQVGTATPHSVLEVELRRLHDQIDDILLTLLQYSGAFHPFWQADPPLMFPGRTAIP